jgi:2'-5' RNA ligase
MKEKNTRILRISKQLDKQLRDMQVEFPHLTLVRVSEVAAKRLKKINNYKL